MPPCAEGCSAACTLKGCNAQRGGHRGRAAPAFQLTLPADHAPRAVRLPPVPQGAARRRQLVWQLGGVLHVRRLVWVRGAGGGGGDSLQLWRVLQIPFGSSRFLFGLRRFLFGSSRCLPLFRPIVLSSSRDLCCGLAGFLSQAGGQPVRLAPLCWLRPGQAYLLRACAGRQRGPSAQLVGRTALQIRGSCRVLQVCPFSVPSLGPAHRCSCSQLLHIPLCCTTCLLAQSRRRRRARSCSRSSARTAAGGSRTSPARTRCAAHAIHAAHAVHAEAGWQAFWG